MVTLSDIYKVFTVFLVQPGQCLKILVLSLLVGVHCVELYVWPQSGTLAQT